MLLKNHRKSCLSAVLVMCFLYGCFSVCSAQEDSVIKIRVSYKIMLNPETGARPKDRTHTPITNETIEDAVREMNALFASYWRGYRLELVEIREVSFQQGAATNCSRWFKYDFAADKRRDEVSWDLEKTARKGTSYHWNKNALNIYINQGTSGGKWNKFETVIIGSKDAGSGWLHLHEISHYFGLLHTHGNLFAEFNSIGSQADFVIPGDDEIEDTIEDLPDWNRDKIAKHNYAKRYDRLTDTLRDKVDDVAENVMSYHFQKPIGADLTRMTEGQLDRFTSSADEYFSRRKIRDGSTLNAHPKDCDDSAGRHASSAALSQAVHAANTEGGDIILLSEGSYEGNITINKPLTLRATRKGPATIGIGEGGR